MESFPKIRSVHALPNHHLLVVFKNKVAKIYDCRPLLQEEVFSPLMSKELFDQVRADTGGYGVVWNDTLDLSEGELWLKGVEAAGVSISAIIRQHDVVQ